MTLYLLSVPHDSETEPTMATMDAAELEATLAAVGAFNATLEAAGALRFAGGLHPPSSATTIDGAPDVPTTTPGPFVEAPEYLGGMWVIEVDDEEAAGRAGRLTGTHEGPRPQGRGPSSEGA